MYALTEFRVRTLESARNAVRLYFQPLLALNDSPILAKLSKLEPTVGFRPIAVAPTARLRSELNSWRRRLQERKHPTHRISEARAALEWSEIMWVEVEHLARLSEEEYRSVLEQWYATKEEGRTSLRPLYYQTQLSRWFKRAAWLLTAMEVAILSILLPMLADVTMLTAVGVAVALALILSVATTAAVGGVMLERFESQPRRAGQMLTPRIAAVGSANLVLICILVLVRTGGASLATAQYVLVALAVLTLALVALLQSASKLFGWSSELTRQWEEIEGLRAEIKAFHSYASEVLDQNEQLEKQAPETFDRLRRRVSLQDEEVG